MDVNYLIAFSSGLLSFFAPCVVPLLPSYVSYITGVSVKNFKDKKSLLKYRKHIFLSSIFYSLGFSLIFVLMGTSASGIGSLLRINIFWLQTLGGILIMIFALEFLGILKLSFLIKGFNLNLPYWINKIGYLRPFVVGIIFATAWSPCVGPVLGVILTLAATTETIFSGASLLFIYSLGILIPFVLIANSLAQTPFLLKKILPYLDLIGKISGIFLLIIGFLLFNNQLQLISKNLTYNHLNAVVNSWDLRIKNNFLNRNNQSETIESLINEAKAKYPTLVESETKIGEKLSKLEFKTFDNDIYQYNPDQNQEPVVFYFWATWLPIVYIDMPILETMSQTYQNINFVGIHKSDTEDEAVAKDFLTQNQITFIQVHDDGSFYNMISGIGLPVYAFVDSNGILIEVFQGSLEPSLLEKKLENLIN